MEKSAPSKNTHSTSSYSVRITGLLILFSVILGTTDIGFIPVPTEARYATTMHLPTILASLSEGWPIGLVVGAVFGLTSMYASISPITEDPIIAIIPRLLVGVTPFLTYYYLRNAHEYVRLAMGAVVGTLTNTVLFLGLAVARGFLHSEQAMEIGLVHGVPEIIVAVLIVVPGVLLLRKLKIKMRGGPS